MAHKFIISLLMIALHMTEAATVPAIFIFGDSTVDVGTNDYLPESKAKANVQYNGIDLPDWQPTGRFSNGYNTADMIVRLLGYRRSPPPFLSLLNNRKPFMRNILQGVNFASGGSGLLNMTGKQYKKVISMREQVQQFASVHHNISEVMDLNTEAMISRSLFLISVGSNDIFEYFASNHTSSNEDFMATLIHYYQIHLKNLTDLGARKFGIIGVPPLGCCPFVRSLNDTGVCMEGLNVFAQFFNWGLEDLLDELSSEVGGMKYSLGNTYDMTMNIIDNPLTFGFKEVKEACCGKGILNAEHACRPTSNVCFNRNEFLFWDQYHPTQAASRLAALTLYGGSPRFATPINFSQLAEIDV